MISVGNFPDEVNENAARLVALFVFIFVLLSIFFSEFYFVFILMIGFFLRMLYGPKYSVTAKLVLNYIIPLLKISNKQTPGPPKRFAQTIGFVFSFTACIFFLLKLTHAYQITLIILGFFCFLEFFFGFCAGCFVFGLLMKFGIVPEEICERCNNLNYKKDKI